MNRIRIDERDFTTPILNTYDNEIAYVPGFATAGEADKPTLCSSVSDFLSKFATRDSEQNIIYPRYVGDQTYPATSVVVPSCEATTDISQGEVTVIDSVFYSQIQESGTYVFTASVSGSTVTWSLESETVNISDYGLTIDAGTPADEDTITVVLTTSTVSSYVFPEVAVPEGGFWAEGGDIDPSFLYAIGLLSMGIQVVYERMNDTDADITVEKAYTKLNQYFSSDSDGTIADKSTYNIKYLTSGAYPTFEYIGAPLSTNMLNIASNRGDCIAFIDHTNNPNRPLSGSNSVLSSVRENMAGSEYGAMFTPWGNYTVNYGGGSCDFPGSYAYLTALGKSNQTNDSWLAIAGIARGGVVNLTSTDGIRTINVLTNTIAENMGYNNEAICINPITRINGAQTIWGNRTLKKNANGATATSFLNIRNLICDVKKQAYTAAKAAIFEPNDDVLWLNFKSAITPLLDRMVTGRGLTNYKIIKNINDDPTKLDATIKLYPIYAVEAVDIFVELHDDDTVTTTE